MGKPRRQEPKAEWVLIETTLAKYLDRPSEHDNAQERFKDVVPEPQRNNIDAILVCRSLSYREMALIQLAFMLCSSGIEPTQRPEGARGIGKLLGNFLTQHHIVGTADAYQNTGKNDDNLVRGNYVPSDAFLTWAREAPRDQLEASFEYICAELASFSRPVSPMPDLVLSKLTFANMMRLVVDMLATPSEGEYQQFIVAALVDIFHQFARTGYHVDTKPVNVSDKSSKAAGDVVASAGTKPQEAYEVTANDWETKTVDAAQKLREHSLKAMHIVAAVEDYSKMAEGLAAVHADLSVVDLYGFTATILSLLPKMYRSLVLDQLYDNLASYGKTDRVNDYVALLISRGLGVVPQKQ